MPVAITVALRLVACSAATYLVWRWIGPASIAICAPLFGISLARPILDMVESSVLLAKRLAYHELSGRHFQHRGFAIDIEEDSTFHRWVKTDDARKVVPGLPHPQALERMFPEQIRFGSARDGSRIQAEALDAYLGKSTEANSLKFRLWLQREVILPANNRRDRNPSTALPRPAPQRPDPEH